MTQEFNSKRHSRRAFFRQGGTALAAGLASAGAGATTLMLDETLPLQQQLEDLQQQLTRMEDRDAMRQLFLAYHSLLEKRHFEPLLGLFTRDATLSVSGRDLAGREQDIRRHFMDDYAHERLDHLQCGFSQLTSQQNEAITLSDDAQSARGVFRASIRWSRPLKADSVLEQMARQQGLGASQYWQDTRFDVHFAREDGQWKIRRLHYQPA